MGQFITPLDGQTLVRGSTINITYQVDTRPFGSPFSQVHALIYYADNVQFLMVTPPDAPAPAQHTVSYTLPTTGNTLNLKVEARNSTGTLQSDESTDINLILADAPAQVNDTEAMVVKLCTIAGVVQMCDQNGDSILLVNVHSSDGDLIPTTSTEFPASTGHGVFSTIGYFRSYCTDLNGNYLTTQPTTVTTCATISSDNEFLVLCDNNGEFLRRYKVEETAITVIDTLYDGITPYTPVGTPRLCTSSVSSDFQLLCDNNTTFIRRYDKDADGNISSVDTLVNGITPYTPVGTVRFCDSDVGGTTSVINDCNEVGTPVVTIGSNLLDNGDFIRSTGFGATSVFGPGWTSGYTAVENIYAGGAGTMAFFTTNGGQSSNNQAIASTIPALTGRSLIVNVGPNTAQPILSWPSVYLENGATYQLEADAAIISLPYGVSINIDGVAISPLVAPNAAGQWRKTQTVFTYNGTSGYHEVGIYSNNAAASGNDHCFDNFSLKKVSPAVVETRTNSNFTTTVKALVPHIVETAGCFDSRRDELLGQILSKSTGSGYIVPICAAGVTMLRVVDEKNVVTFLSTNGVFVTAPVAYTIGQCGAAGTRDALILCDDNTSFLRRYDIDTAGVVTIVNTTLNGTTAYTPVGTVKQCGSTGEDSEYIVLCDNNRSFLRRYTRIAGVLTIFNTTMDGATTYTPVGTVVKCTECCPQVVGEGCWVNGANSGKYTAIRSNNGNITLIDQISGATIPVAQVTTCTPSTDLNLTPSIQRVVGAANIVIPVNARSVTVTVIAGTPTVQIGATPAVTLPTGSTFSWSGDRLTTTFTFVGVAGTDFIITTVR